MLCDEEELQSLIKSGYFQDNSDMQKRQEMVHQKQTDFDPNTSLKAITDPKQRLGEPRSARSRPN